MLLEKIISMLWKSERYQRNNEQVIFIVSTGRTGTQFIAKFFNGFPGICAKHEPWPDMWELGHKLIRRQVSFDYAVRRYVYERRKIFKEVHKKRCSVYMESNRSQLYLIPVIQKIFSNYYIIHVIRDARNYVRSAYSKSPINDDIMLFMGENDHRKRLAATDFPDDPYYEKWQQMSRFQKICWYWVKANNIIFDSCKGDSRTLLLKYEDLFDKKRNYLGILRLAKFASLNVDLECVENFSELMGIRENETKHYLLPAWADWEHEYKKQFIEIAGEHMQRWGYPL